MITVQNVYKSFGSIKALNGLSLAVPAGKIFGLIGPNGAGKTTTIRILSGLMFPDAGHVRLNGAGPDQYLEIRRMTGALIEQPGLYGKLTLNEYLTFFSRMYDLNRRQARQRIRELLELLELNNLEGERLQGFSLGMKQKVALARILLHDPPILLLDEPTAGLDPLISKKVRDYLLVKDKPGSKTVLVSTHNLDEASRVCDEIAIIQKGRIMEQGSWEALRERHASQGEVVIQLGEFQDKYKDILSGENGLSRVRTDTVKKTISYEAVNYMETNPRVVSSLVAAGAQVISVEVGGTTLEEAYLKLIGNGI